MNVFFFLISTASLFSCGEKKAPSVATPSTTVQEPKKTPLSLAPMQYDSELQPDRYPTAAATDIPLLRWNFSKEFSVQYTLSQHATSTTLYNFSADNSEPHIQKASTSGILKVHSTGDSLAEISILDLQAIMQTGPADNPKEAMAPPETVIRTTAPEEVP